MSKLCAVLLFWGGDIVKGFNGGFVHFGEEVGVNLRRGDILVAQEVADLV